MKIKVENLGAIKQGEIDLSKNLILFTGPNNSGKSYMSYLVYGFYELISTKSKWSEKVTEKVQETIQKVTTISENGYKYSVSIEDLITPLGRLFEEQFKNVIDTSDNDVFGTDIGLSHLSFKIDFDKQYLLGENNSEESDDYITEIQDGVFTLEAKSSLRPKEVHISYDFPLFVSYLFLRAVFGNGLGKIVTFFPAERTALTMVAKEIVKNKASERDEIIRKLQYSKISELKKEFQDKLPRYPLAIADYIDWVNDLDQITRNESEFHDLANEIEELMLKGKVSTSDFGNIRFTPPKSKKPLELHVSSSLVKSLSGLILYLRHQAREHDVIMIDEPELNLHPDSQILVARALAKLVNAGFKLIISTHSDYIIKEMNNLIMLHKQKGNKELIQSFDCTEDMLIDREDMSVYFFNEGTIKDLEITETGVAIPTINSAIDEMNDRMEDIYYKVFEENEEMAD
ncbi:MAG: ABC-type Mn2+/Zn2+ transport system ATPase subunit [Flammeovirgaceae bacterium]|jgi:ABC-type Mn2+/Zn2+ transport system ATPase subunit